MPEGERYRIEIRTTPSFKRKLRNLLRDLYDLGLREDKNLTAYTIEALEEKRANDNLAIERKRESMAGQKRRSF